ncbi:MAG: hypothetical protein HWN81_08705 [Candidatus Lokiarchaeota archaeon]|nr:hypothetical protein [Candidatus Lokiarchaeota archaeon]
MKNKELSLFYLSKIATYEILIEEQLERLESIRFRYFKRKLSSKDSLKRRFILSKIFGAFIFGILPIIPLLTYFQVLDFINEGEIPIELILFAGSLLFGIFFIFQFFNFFLMVMLNTMKILSGNIFEWFETLPISRGKLKKLILLTIIHSLDIPLIVITISFPIMMLIGTQNLLIFLICIGVSILNTIFSFSILILFSERMNRVLNINDIGSKRTHFIRLINLVSYIIIVIGSVFIIQWSLSSIETFFVLFGRSRSPVLVILILSMIPFPIAPGYLISSFIAPNQIPFQIWYNIFIGFSLFLILTWLIYQQSIKGIRKTTYSKFKKDSKTITKNMKEYIKIKVRSPVWAYIRKDLIISTRNLKNFLSVVMPIVIGFIFTFTYNISTIGGVSPFDIDSIFNFFVIIGFNIVISGMTVYSLLNMEESGASILASLPLQPQEQAKAKLFLMYSIQTITVLAPSFMYIGKRVFINSILTALSALPFVLLFMFIMFELWVFFFGKSKNLFVIEEVLPENKIRKWLEIFLIEYFIYFAILTLSFTFYSIKNLLLMLLFLISFLIIGFISTSFIFERVFPSIKKDKISVEGIPTYFIRHIWKSLILILALNIVILYVISLFHYPFFFIFPEKIELNHELYKFFYFFIFNIFYLLLWIAINPYILGLPSGRLQFKQYLKKIIFGRGKSTPKKIFFSIFVGILIFFINFYIVYSSTYEIIILLVVYILYNLFLIFSYYFWQEIALRSVMLPLILNKVKKWKAIILNNFMYSISQFFFLYITRTIPTGFIKQTFILGVPAILIEFLFIFLTGFIIIYVYIKIENVIIASSFSLTLNITIRHFILVQLIIWPIYF